MKQTHHIKVFISCPNDIKDELDSISLTIEELNKTSGRLIGYTLELVNWKMDTYSAIGEDPQQVINDQLEKEYDILLGIIWQKLGTPTKRDRSGTAEELNRAIANNKPFLLYFKTEAPTDLNEINFEELSKVYAYKRDLGNRGVLYKEFNSIKTFETFLRIQLPLVCEQVIKNTIKHVPTISKYKEISQVIEIVESRDDAADEQGLLDLGLQATSYLEAVTFSLTTMTSILNNLTANLTKRTAEIKSLSNLKDERLKLKKSKVVVDFLAGELDEFNQRMDVELPTFSNNILPIGPIYSQIKTAAKNSDAEDLKLLDEHFLKFRDSIEGATKGSADILSQVLRWPAVTKKFNKSKRETEITLKNVTKEMLQGLILIDEALRL